LSHSGAKRPRHARIETLQTAQGVTISSDHNISRLQGNTINLYKEIEGTSGQSVGMHATGGFCLASNDEWHDYLKRDRSKARYMGLDQESISVEEAARRHPHRVGGELRAPLRHDLSQRDPA
jgi:glycine/D-amino acid oxidase-like deaminating enzyme